MLKTTDINGHMPMRKHNLAETKTKGRIIYFYARLQYIWSLKLYKLNQNLWPFMHELKGFCNHAWFKPITLSL